MFPLELRCEKAAQNGRELLSKGRGRAAREGSASEEEESRIDDGRFRKRYR